MSKYIKEFLLRGAVFASFGPIVLGIVYWIIDSCGVELNLQGYQIFIAIFSISILSFIHAGTTVFHQIEEWSPMKSALFQLGILYVTYIGTYLLNNWLPIKIEIIGIFTLIFVATYFLIWLIVLIIVKITAKKLNKKL